MECKRLDGHDVAEEQDQRDKDEASVLHPSCAVHRFVVGPLRRQDALPTARATKKRPPKRPYGERGECVTALRLEEQLQSELDLPGGAGVAGGEAGGADHTKGGGTRGLAGLSEVRVVKQVKEFGAELSGEPLRDLCGLEHREVNGLKTRADERIAMHIAKVETIGRLPCNDGGEEVGIVGTDRDLSR
jgi:hypothetical protein